MELRAFETARTAIPGLMFASRHTDAASSFNRENRDKARPSENAPRNETGDFYSPWNRGRKGSYHS